MDKSSSVAVFIDVENILYSTLNCYSETPDWSWVVEACKEYGRISSIQAFGDWVVFSRDVPEIQKNGIQPVFVPRSQNGKSSLDCYLTVSAMKMFFQNNSVDTMILASGDRDYIPLIAELKALGKKVIILAVPNSLSEDLTKIVDGIISYKPLPVKGSQQKDTALVDRESVWGYVVDVLAKLEEPSVNNRWVNLARIGLELKSQDPAFAHVFYGYASLVDMLSDIPEIEMRYDNPEKTVAVARTIFKNSVGPLTDTLEGRIFGLKERYGFIEPESGSENIFFHFSGLLNISFGELSVGDLVTYSIDNTDCRPCARNIKKIS